MCAVGSQYNVVAVGRRLRNDIGADGSARTCAVIDDDLLAPALGELLSYWPRQNVCAPAGRKRHHDTHGFARESFGRVALCQPRRTPGGRRRKQDQGIDVRSHIEGFCSEICRRYALAGCRTNGGASPVAKSSCAVVSGNIVSKSSLTFGMPHRDAQQPTTPESMNAQIESPIA